MIDRRQLSKALSRIAGASVEEILAVVEDDSGRRARVIGVTGSPGAGKSTLIGKLAAARLEHASRLAIIAIDPTSPVSDGSLLGDRIRMGALSEHPRVFIRSLPSRAAEDGLTDNVAEIVATLDRFGFDEVIIETVGAGQTAYGVRAISDVEILVLTPGAGDYVQAMKAGIMETADIYVVNKADQPGADRVVGELLGVARHGPDGHPPSVLQVRHDEAAGFAALDSALQQHFARAFDPVEVQRRRRSRRRFRVRKLLQRRLHEALAALPEEAWDEPLPAAYAWVLRRLVQRNDP
jgi:LAO/AO transport system kinase